MTWARAAIAGGLLVLAAAFAFGTEPVSSTSVAHQRYVCDSVLPASWLVAGTPDPAPVKPQSGQDRRAAAQCHAIVQRNRILMWGAIGVGGVVALVGWTALRERDRSVLARRAPVRA